MEIQFTKFNELKEKIYSMPKYVPDNMYMGAIYCFKIDEPDIFDEEGNEKLMTAAKEMSQVLGDKPFYELDDEIELNVVNIGSNEAVIRYLSYLKEQAIHFREMLEAYFDFEYFASVEEKIEAREWIWSGEKEYKTFIAKMRLQARENGGNYQLTTEELAEHRSLKENREAVKIHPVGFLLDTYLYKIKQCRELISTLENKIDSIANPAGVIHFENSVNVSNHRLLLFHKLGLFRPLFHQYFNLLGPTKFAMLIKTVLGITDEDVKPGTFKKAVENFIKEIDNVRVEKPVITDRAANKVDAFLAEIGLLSTIDNQS
jgi:hypothetical protein